MHVTGYFFFPYNNTYNPTNDLKDFLDTGKPPVCVSFGSMVNKNADRVDAVVRDALKQTNNRGIILSGWGSVRHESTSDLLYLESASHDWLLPKCKMLIHHGGAGTTSAGLRAGIPQIVVPFMADQPFWGNRVYAIGVAPKPIRVSQFSVEMVVRSIAEAESKTIAECAHATSQCIRDEDGVLNAVMLIESYAKHHH